MVINNSLKNKTLKGGKYNLQRGGSYTLKKGGAPFKVENLNEEQKNILDDNSLMLLDLYYIIDVLINTLNYYKQAAKQTGGLDVDNAYNVSAEGPVGVESQYNKLEINPPENTTGYTKLNFPEYPEQSTQKTNPSEEPEYVNMQKTKSSGEPEYVNMQKTNSSEEPKYVNMQKTKSSGEPEYVNMQKTNSSEGSEYETINTPEPSGEPVYGNSKTPEPSGEPVYGNSKTPKPSEEPVYEEMINPIIKILIKEGDDEYTKKKAEEYSQILFKLTKLFRLYIELKTGGNITGNKMNINKMKKNKIKNLLRNYEQLNEYQRTQFAKHNRKLSKTSTKKYKQLSRSSTV
jgi:hypothetical protein